MPTLGDVTPARWQEILIETFRRVSENPQCAPILAHIGRIRFQLLIRDRGELSYWEDYCGDRVVPYLGMTATWTVQASTTFRVFVDTLLRRTSIMEAAADELWEVCGDTEALMRCANLLPYVMLAFAGVVAQEGAAGRTGHG